MTRRLCTLIAILAAASALVACGGHTSEPSSAEVRTDAVLAAHGSRLDTQRTAALFELRGLPPAWPGDVPRPQLGAIASSSYEDRWTAGVTVIGPVDDDAVQAVQGYGARLAEAGFELVYTWDRGATMASTYERGEEFVQVESFVAVTGTELAVTYLP